MADVIARLAQRPARQVKRTARWYTPRRWFRAAAPAVLLLIVGANSAAATTIVGVRTDDFVEIAADSLASDSQGRTWRVCKVFAVNAGAFAISGLTKRIRGSGFDLEKLVAATLENRQSIPRAASELEHKVQDAVERELRRVQKEAPADFSHALNAGRDTTTVLIIGVDNGVPHGHGFSVRGRVDADVVSSSIHHLACPGADCPNNVLLFRLGKTSNIKRRVDSGLGIRDMKTLVEIEIEARTPGVGGPVDALRIDRTGDVEWLSRKADCPSSGVAPNGVGAR